MCYFRRIIYDNHIYDEHFNFLRKRKLIFVFKYSNEVTTFAASTAWKPHM